MHKNDPKRSARTTAAALAFAALAVLACSGGPSDDAAEMGPIVEPHLEELADFDRWARRLSLADSAFRSEEALEEAAFAPLRRRPRVVAAWLDRRGPDPRRLRHPEDAPDPPEDGWVRVRTDALGDVAARRATLRVGTTDRPCVLVRRSAPAPGGATLDVTLAFDAAGG